MKFHIATDHLVSQHFHFPNTHWARLIKNPTAPTSFDAEIPAIEVVNWLHDNEIEWTLWTASRHINGTMFREFYAILRDAVQASHFRLAYPEAIMTKEDESSS